MNALVTGGGGFLGTALCRQLVEGGHTVRSFSRSSHAHLAQLGVEELCGNLDDLGALRRAMDGCDSVFHVAAKAGVWGARKEFQRTNVVGTENVLRACADAGVLRLVHTSSPSVCFDGTDHVDADNSLPLATSFLAPYPETKAHAERAALAANSPTLATCALRPHLIFGPGDPHLLPRLVGAARAGKLPRVGNGTNTVTVCYVENAAHAHVQAAESLVPGAKHSGQAYFIGQEQPVLLWDWIGELLSRVGAPPIRKTLSRRSAYAVGALLEVLWRGLRLPGEPRMTRFVATQLATSHSYSMEPAREAFGYEELVSLDDATQRTVDWLRESC